MTGFDQWRAVLTRAYGCEWDEQSVGKAGTDGTQLCAAWFPVMQVWQLCADIQHPGAGKRLSESKEARREGSLVLVPGTSGNCSEL